MKKSTRWIVTLGAAGCVAAVAVPVINLSIGAPTGTVITKGAAGRADMQAVAELLERSCGNCHTEGTKLPWYASMPGASAMIEKDVETGRRYFDLGAGLYPSQGGPTTEPTLAKIEWTVQSGRMPPFRYKIAHWESSLGDDDLSTLMSWVKSMRAKHYAPGGLVEAIAAGPVHPLPASVEVDQKKAELGETLYFDGRLSGDETISCASCHDLSKGGTDQAPVSTGIRGQKGGINAPTTYNAMFHLAQFWDGRAADLKEQAGGPPLNPIEMGSSWEQILGRLTADEAVVSRFTEAFGEGGKVTPETITGAIAEYERTLLTPDAPFDKFLMGDGGALNDEAWRGWELFQTHGCHTCHVGKVLGGQSYELMGRAHDYFAERGTPETDADAGRFSVTKDEADRHKFKVPGLRNVALTQPYFHDASAEDLASAVRTMAHVQLGVDLSGPDVEAIVAFLDRLTGTFQGKALSEAPTEPRQFAAPEPEPGTGTDEGTGTGAPADQDAGTAEAKEPG